jgi:hypothetical protein
MLKIISRQGIADFLYLIQGYKNLLKTQIIYCQYAYSFNIGTSLEFKCSLQSIKAGPLSKILN